MKDKPIHSKQTLRGNTKNIKKNKNLELKKTKLRSKGTTNKKIQRGVENPLIISFNSLQF